MFSRRALTRQLSALTPRFFVVAGRRGMTEEAAAVLDLTVEAYVRAFVAANESAVSYGASTQLPIDRQCDDEV